MNNPMNNYMRQASRKSNELNSPKYPHYFKKRVCIRYVKNPKTNTCAGCNKEEGQHQYIFNESKWDSAKCTKLEPTDAYGVLTFPGSHSKKASYIRIEDKTNVKEMIQYLYAKEGWGLQKPQLILSITGGAQNFTIPHRMKKAFKRGLIKAAASTGAWIITGGTNTGVMRLVGEAVADELQKFKTNITLIGIATWGKIFLRENMTNKPNTSKRSLYTNRSENSTNDNNQYQLFYAKKETEFSATSKKVAPSGSMDIMLDPNHTHFILVDDGSEGHFGKEIGFRASLEVELRKGKSLKEYQLRQKKRYHSQKSSDEENDDYNDEVTQENLVPMVLIVVQGGPNTLLTVEESVKKNVPVLILADSKGCADLIANACACTKPDKDTLLKLIDESKMFDKFKNTPNWEKETAVPLKRLEFIISKIPDNLINVFRLDSEEGSQDIELAILRAFLNSRKNQHYENLKLALQWNRDDIAKIDIFTGEEDFKSYQLEFLMEMALVQNKPRFVELLLENGLNLKSFLTVRRLIYLYNSQKIRQTAKKAPLFKLLKKKHMAAKNVHVINFTGLNKFLKDYLFEDFKAQFFLEDPDLEETISFLNISNKRNTSDCLNDEIDKNFGTEEYIYPEQNLFLWAMLTNRIEIAKIFWQIGEHQICNALFASKLFKSMSVKLKDLEKELNSFAEEMEEMACEVLCLFDSMTDDLINHVLLLQEIPYYKINCLKMAEEADCLKFISLPCVQDILTDIWNGQIETKEGFKGRFVFLLCCFSFGFLSPFFLFGRKTKLSRMETLRLNLEKMNVPQRSQAKILSLMKGYFFNDEGEYDQVERVMNFLCWKFTKKTRGTNSENDTTDDDDDDDDDDDEATVDGMQDTENNDEDENVHEIALDSEINVDDSIQVKIRPVSLQQQISQRQETFDQEIEAKKAHNQRSLLKIYFSRYLSFMNAPKVLFFYDCLFFVMFLSLFSYILLCDFVYYESVEDFDEYLNVTNTSALIQNVPKYKKVVKYPSSLEWVLTFWIFALLSDEIYQFITSDTEEKLSYKIYRYFESKWNYIDVMGCSFFIIGFIIRMISLTTNENVFIAARLIYAFDLSTWSLRVLHCLIIFKSLGPKIIMIQQMVYDLTFFIFLILIFVLTFGVTTQATLYPGNNFDSNLLRSIIDKSYWPIYGEMTILGELIDRDEICQSKPENCPEYSGTIFSYIALMMYMVVANVLLINLLIAMFSSTFERVQENNDNTWNFQRYKLVFEYHDSSVIPPPLNFLSYIYILVVKIKNKIKGITSNDNKSEDELWYERKYAEEYMKLKKLNERETMESRLKWNNEKLETLEQKLNEVIDTRAKVTVQANNAMNWLMSKMELLSETSGEAPYIEDSSKKRKTK